jgi:hypothetical protein
MFRTRSIWQLFIGGTGAGPHFPHDRNGARFHRSPTATTVRLSRPPSSHKKADYGDCNYNGIQVCYNRVSMKKYNITVHKAVVVAVAPNEIQSSMGHTI